MKFGMRKPSLKRSIKARTTGKLKRKIKKTFIPGYGKKGMGWLKNPKKSVYNKVYNKTTFSISDLFKFNFKSKSKASTKNKISDMKEDEFVKNLEKVPFYKKKWFIILVSLFVPIAGIVFVLKSKKMNKLLKIILTAIASLWSMILLIIGFAGGESDDTVTPVETTSPTSIEEMTTHNNTLYETTTLEEKTEEPTTEELTTNPTTTKKETTTAKPTTTKKETTKPVATTQKPAATRNPDAGVTVYRTKSGNKYHYENPCGNGTYSPISLDDAKAIGLEPCEKCVLH